MTTDQIATTNHLAAAVLERVIVAGDLKDLTPTDRVMYYKAKCESVGLNPLTRPFRYILFKGRAGRDGEAGEPDRLELYADKGCAEQLRTRDNITLELVRSEVIEGIYIATARATRPDGRHDEDYGAVSIEKLYPSQRANAIMRAVTKAKRRVTLSICGLGMPDESELPEIQGAETDLDDDGGVTVQAKERRRLYDQIIAVADRMGLKPEERKAAWKEHLQEAKPETADPSALQDLLTALEEREKGTRV